jgi:hypothetical protein
MCRNVTIARLFKPAAAALLAVMATAMFASALQECDTWDEAWHLVAGYAYWKTGSYAAGVDHPPLGRLWEALPLLAFPLDFPVDREAYASRDLPALGRAFLYRNRVPAETMLAMARAMTMLVALSLGLALALWTRARFGPGAALVALALFAFDPNFTAHGRYTTNDVIVALFYFLAAVSWTDFLSTNRRRSLWFAGLGTGLALLSKTSALIALPLLPLLYLICWRRERAPHCSIRHMALSLATAYGLAAVLVLLFYAPDAWHTWPPTLLHALDDTLAKSRIGHLGYLLGNISMSGWWHYFPVAIAVKSTTVVVALLLAGGICLFWRGIRRMEFPQLAVLVSAALFLAVAIASRINIGLRHILPAYPLLYVAFGVMLARWANTRRRVMLVVALLAAHAAESASIYPHYLAFFNTLAGGAANGPRYLSDSNIDWGQDAKHLRAYLEAHHIDDACICYFGNADFAYYRIKGRYLPPTIREDDLKRLDCVAAVSVTPLTGLYVPPNAFRWLREQRPAARVGYSIYIYDLRPHMRK